MANTVLAVVNNTTFSWQITGLSSAWNTAAYQSAGIFASPATAGQSAQPSGGISSATAPASGTSTSTPVTNVGGMTAGNTYTVYGATKAANGLWYPAGSASITLPAPAQPPQGTPVVSLTAMTGHFVYVSWSGVTGATSYQIYANTGSGDFWKATVSSSGYSITVDAEWTYATIKVIPSNDAGTGITGSNVVRTLDITYPTILNFYSTGSSRNSITVLGQFTDPAPANGSASGAERMEFWRGGSRYHTEYTNSAEFTFTGLAPNTAYTLELRVYDVQGNMSSTSRVSNTTNRPLDFDWDTAKIQGATFNLTAAEWNGFIARVNEFRAYRGLGAATYNSAVTGQRFTAAQFNQMRTAINDMSPSVAVPAVATAGGQITAARLNGLRNSLNSIT